MVGVITMIVFTVTSYAQISGVAATSDSTVVIDKVYAGTLAGSAYLCGKDTSTAFASFRFGASALWHMGTKLTLKTFAVGEYEAVTGSSFGIHAMWLQYRPLKKIAIEAGKGSTLVAQQHRPFPVSQYGQFETWTQARLPGVGYTCNLKYIPNAKTLFGAGISVRDNMSEYQVTTTIRRIQLSGYYQTATNVTCGAITYSGKSLFNTAFVKTDAIGDFSSLLISRKRSVYLFTDFGYDRKTSTIVRWGSGFSKTFSMKYVKGILALAYTYENNGASLYTLISL